MVERQQAWPRRAPQERQQQVSLGFQQLDLKELELRQEQRVYQPQVWFLIEPILREQLSPRPELQAAPQSASAHLPAAVEGGI